MSTSVKNRITLVGAMASVAVLTITVVGWLTPVDSSQTGEDRQEYGFTPWMAPEEEPQQKPPTPAAAPQEKGLWIQLIDPSQEPVRSRVVLNSPGMWPSVTDTTDDGGYFALPEMATDMLDGRPFQLYEIIARPETDDGEEVTAGYWGLVRGPDEEVTGDQAVPIRMQPAFPMQLVVVDVKGEPIEGAYVRLARDSVGLVFLNYTTLEDGRASFRGIPRGNYYLTLDAQGYARTTVHVEHTPGATGPMMVVMVGGAGLRLPGIWRGPPVAELVAATASQGDGGSGSTGEGGDQGEATGAVDEDEDATVRSEPVVTAQVAVYAATDRGSGVEGAWLEAWSEGRRVAQARSGGNRPVMLEVPKGPTVEIIATHAGWGEGVEFVSDVSDGDEVVVRMEDPLLTARGASDRVRDVGAIEDALDVELVADGQRWLIELPRQEGSAQAAGVERGDSLLFVRRQGTAYHLVVERRREVVEIALGR